MVMLSHPDFKGVPFVLNITVMQEGTNPLFTAEIGWFQVLICLAMHIYDLCVPPVISVVGLA